MTKPQGRSPLYRRQLGLAIRRRREAVRLSQEKLAELADVHRNYIGLVERGDQNLTVETLVRIAKALNCRSSALLTDAGI
jgi:transcriptional regulator with XRE-family HTH domain